MSISYQCYTCKHYLSPNFCDAFPEGSLPDAIFTGEVIHDHPIHGDHGVRWERIDGTGRPLAGASLDDPDITKQAGTLPGMSRSTPR